MLACKLAALLLALVSQQLCAALWFQPARYVPPPANQARYELKFQHELDNSTIIKREMQQQVFKCQVRLAPITKQSGLAIAKFKTYLISSANGSASARDDEQLAAPSSWPTNVTLSIDWFRDDQQLAVVGGGGGGSGEQVSVINVELKNNNSGSNAKNTSLIDKKNKPRLEIKNTLNGSQLKLTSRLKLSQLRASDSGQYRCIANVNFTTYNELAMIVTGSSQLDANVAASSVAGRPSPWRIQQALDSNAANLVVIAATANNFSTSADEPPGMQNELAGGRSGSGGGGGGISLGEDADGTQRRRTSTIESGKQRNPIWRDLANDRSRQARPTEEMATIRAGRKQHTTSPTTTTTIPNSMIIAGGSLKNGANNALDLHQQLQQQQQQHASGSKSSQFEDDEDLYKMDTRGKFISAPAGSVPQQANDDDEEEATDRRIQFAAGDPLSAIATSGAADPPEWNGGEIVSDGERSPDDNNNNNNANTNLLADDEPSSVINNQHAVSGSTTTNQSRRTANTDFAGGRGGVFAVDGYLAGSLDSTRLRLAKFVHKLAPELSCYTGNGEHYRGNVSTSQDGRVCLSWALAKSAARFKINHQEELQHNNCRNPNLDKGGPWCYVLHDELLDGPLLLRDSASLNFIVLLAKNKNNNNNSNSNSNSNSNNTSRGSPLKLPANGPLRYLQRPCSVSACSEYLWFYIVAPPFGFLVMLSCFVTILIRSMRRKSHYNSIFSPLDGGKHARRSLPNKFTRFLKSKSRGHFAPKKFACSNNSNGTKKKCCSASSSQKHYLDDDIFEIVDDLDWSDGNQTQSLSPKSSESLKLTSSSFSSSSHDATESSRILSSCKSTNPIFCDRLPADAGGQSSLMGDLMNSKQANYGVAQQVGPMFATLRCHIRGKKVNQQQQIGFNSNHSANKSSTFIEQCDLAASGNSNQQHHKLQAPLIATNSSSTQTSGISSPLPKDSQCKSLIASQTTTSGSHLISYSSSDNSTKDPDEDEQQLADDCSGEKFIIGNELPKLDASSIAIALEQQQPLYEGKFSQVQLAYINEPVTSTKQNDPSGCSSSGNNSNSNSHNNNNNNNNSYNSSSGRIGAQAAVCWLKSNVQSNFDTQLFSATRLRLRNLNHLNLVKLIGYAELKDEMIATDSSPSSFSLVYDMAQLVDLSDWLKQQSKDIMTGCEPASDFGTRRNLTCFAKQIALALDYLHDKDLVYRDLACRNCFLDPSKMLVKLASFNLEPIISSNDQNAQNLKSMIRPKYLLDYYVIDSRPSDCQLLPLSWIPLESILFNKFNKQTDIWSFGCLIYELFSLGEVAYFGYSSKQVIDAVRSNLTPPQPRLCPNGIYKLMCKCLSDIPTIRPNVKQIYELLNLYSGQCSSFLDHHLCSLDTHTCDDHQQQMVGANAREFLSAAHKSKSSLTAITNNNNSITKTKSYANMRNFNNQVAVNQSQNSNSAYHNLPVDGLPARRAEVAKLPLSKSINMGVSNRTMSLAQSCSQNQQVSNNLLDNNHYDEPILDMRNPNEMGM